MTAVRHAVARMKPAANAFLPVVALTGFVRADDRARILAAGFQAHIPKPVESGDLANIIATLIDDSRGRPA